MKLRRLSLALCLVALGFAFCAAPILAQKTVELTFWNRKGALLGNAHKYIITEFEKLHPNVRIIQRLTDPPKNQEIVRMAFLAGKEPDIVNLNGIFLLEQSAELGYLVDLTDWYGTYGDRFPEAADIWTMAKGRYYGIPMDFHVLAHLYYNEDILNKYGITVPQNWSEFMEACEKLKAEGELPIAFGNKQGNTGEHWLQRLLTETIGASGINALQGRTDPDAGPRWTDAKVLQAVQVFEDLHTKGYFPEEAAVIEYNPGKMMFLSGQGGFYEDGSWFVGGTEIPPDFNWGFFRFPHMEGEIGATRNGGVISYTDTLAISSSSPHREIALEFLEFYSRPEIQGYAYYELDKMWPSVIGGLKGKKLTEFDRAVLEFAEACDDNAPWLSAALPPEVGVQYIWKGNIDISAGEIDAVGFLERLENAHQEYLRKAQ